MRNILKILTVTSITLFYSCTNKLEEKIIKNWRVQKMEKMTPLTLNKYVPIKIDINSKMCYNFLPQNKVKLITQMGSSMQGTWHINDSTISIYTKKEKKELNILKLTDNELVLASGRFKFYLEN
ncbi:hypothetical protein KLA_10975 [Cellulophaga geojensis KL-A]|uniref:Lipocalin-like domain-containing protein n=1 Tax=Cellulophaga geojensis KL-A TaxID=1328323 RepID=A0ABN0RMI8_9FLAO|nr:lipocalin family protein [Cellulophaga geojensis]EWH13062.1 hypothetical protein KLA_10975 [Cellulophaga geojensis KL-A]